MGEGRRGRSSGRIAATLALFCGVFPATLQALECGALGLELFPAATWREGRPAGPVGAVDAFRSYALARDRDQGARTGIRTDAVVVVVNGELVFEAYAPDWTPERRHSAWSVTKSLLNGLYGRAVALGLLRDLEAPAATWVPGLRGGGKDAITLADLFAMSSGLVWNEGYEYSPFLSDVVAMLYTLGREDMAGFAAGHRLAAAPGARFAYKSGDSVILSAALRGIVGASAYPDFPWRALFEPLGMRSAVLERDGSGTFVGSSYLYATARDLARFGHLYAMDGCWAGQRLLPEGWVTAAGTLAPALRDGSSGAARAYGAHWWLNQKLPGGDRPMPSGPENMLVGLGHWGQRLFVLPSQRLVIVRFADDRDRSFSNDRFLELALQAFATP